MPPTDQQTNQALSDAESFFLSRLSESGLVNTTEGLRRVRGKVSSYRRYLDMFLAGHPDDAQKIRNLLTAGEHEEACRCAHSLKGIAAQLGLSHLQAVAELCEQQIKAGVESERLQQNCAELEKTMQRTARAILTASEA